MDLSKYWIINFLPVDIDVIFLIKFTYINIKTKFNALDSKQLMTLSKQGYINYNDVIYKCTNQLIYDESINYIGVRIYDRGIPVHDRRYNITDIYFNYLINEKIYHVYIDFEQSNMNTKNIKVLKTDTLKRKRNTYTCTEKLIFIHSII